MPRLAPRVVVLLWALLAAAFAAQQIVDPNTAANWAGTLTAQLNAVESDLLIVPTFENQFETSAFSARAVSGEEQVALFAVKVTQILASKTRLLGELKTALEDQWAQAVANRNVDNGSPASCDQLNGTATAFGTPCVLVPASVDPAQAAAELRATAVLDQAVSDAWNQTVLPRVRNVFVAGAAAGVVRSYPAGLWQPAPGYDPRLTDWYTGALAGRRRVVVVLDLVAGPSSSVVDAARQLLRSFAAHDAVGVLAPGITAPQSNSSTWDAMAGAGCNSGAFDGLMRATPEALNFLTAALNNVSTAQPLPLRPTLLRAFELANGDGIWLERGYTPWVLLLSATGSHHTGTRDFVAELQDEYSNVRLGVLEVRGGGPPAPEAASELQRAACATGGAYVAVTPGSPLAPLLSPLLHALASQVSDVPPAWLLTLGHRAGNGSQGVLLTLSEAVVVSGRTVAVLGMDVPLDELQQAADQTVFHLSYAFLVGAFGDAVVHPRLATGGSAGAATNLYTRPPLYRDISALEDSPDFPQQVRGPMLSRFSGTATFTLERTLPQGDGAFNAPQTRQVLNTFYWQQLPGFPFVACASYAEEDLVELEFAPEFNGTATPQYYQALTHYPPELLPGGVPVGSPGGASTFLGVDGTTRYTPDLGNYFFAPTAFDDPSYTSRLVDPAFVGAVARFVNGQPGAQNPGVAQQRAVSEVHVTAPALAGWIQAYNAFNPLYRLKILYFASQLGTRRTFPSTLANPLTWYNAVKRPWYLLAVANPDLLVLTPPYLDAASQVANTAPASVLTFCKTVFARDQLVGVSAVDLAYPQLHSFVFSTTGCQRFRNETGAPKCFLLDRSGLLTTSYRFNDPIIVSNEIRTPIVNVFLGQEEPELVSSLLARGVLARVPAVDFAKAPPQLQTVYAVNETMLAPGVQLSGDFASACSQGNYYIQRVPGTNLFFAVIHNYTDNSRNDSSCPAYNSSSAQAQELPYSVCGPNSDTPLFLPAGAGASSLQLQEVLDEARPAGFVCRLVAQEVRRLHRHGWVAILFMVLAGLGLLLCAALAVLVFVYRRVSVIYTTNMAFAATHIAGLALGYASIFVFATRPNDAVCVLLPLLAGVAFVLVVGSMLAKMIRIWRVLSNTTVLSVPITNREFFMYVGAMFAVEAVLLIGWSAGAVLKPRLSLAHASSSTYVLTCRGRMQWVLVGLQAGYCAVLLVAGVVLSFLLRRIHSKVLWGESKWAANCIYTITLLAAVLFVCRVVLRTRPDAQLATTGACIWLMCTATLLLFYSVKFYVLFWRPDLAAQSTVGGDFSTEFTPDDIDEPL